MCRTEQLIPFPCGSLNPHYPHPLRAKFEQASLALSTLLLKIHYIVLDLIVFSDYDPTGKSQFWKRFFGFFIQKIYMDKLSWTCLFCKSKNEHHRRLMDVFSFDKNFGPILKFYNDVNIHEADHILFVV